MPLTLCLAGPAGCGKSTLLMQAANWCADAGWVVLYIPRGESNASSVLSYTKIFTAYTIINSSTYYAYDHKTNTYVQPVYSQRILQRFAYASGQQLNKITLQKQVQLDRRGVRPEGSPLLELIEIGAKDTALAPSVLSHVLEQLGLQTELVIPC